MNKQFLIVALLLLVFVIFAVSCQPHVTVGENDKLTNYYKYFVIDGMPCLSGTVYGGISCDWSKWQGTVNDEQIILPQQ